MTPSPGQSHPGSRTGLPAGLANVLVQILFWASLLSLFGSSLLAHIQLSASQTVFNDDVRAQVYPFLRYEDPEPFQGDYLGNYFLSSRFPVGYRALYAAAGHFGKVDALSRVLPYGLLFLTLLGIGATARRLGGALAAWIALALCLGSAVYLSCVVGGLSRAFGYPIVAGTFVALVCGSAWALAALALAGAAFYPVGAVIAGLCLLLMLLDPVPGDRGDGQQWSLPRRFVILVAVAVGCALLLLPLVIGSRPYGPIITPSEATRFPEAGPGGRYRREDRPPFEGFLRATVRNLEVSVPGAGDPLVTLARRWTAESDRKHLRLVLGLLLAFSGIGWLRLATRRAEARRLLVLPITAAAAYYLSRFLYPYFYLPQRYCEYILPPFAVLMLSCGALGWLPRNNAKRWWYPLVGTVPGILALVFLGARGSTDEGLDIHAAATEPIYAFIGSLPADSLLAGWPSGVIDNVPWVSRRRALVTFETHQAQHVRYTLEMRRRVDAVIEAFYASDPRPLLKLRNQFGVTHFVVDLELTSPCGASYFAPFDRRISELCAQVRGSGLEVLEQIPTAGVYRDRRVAVLDLSRIGMDGH